MTQPPPQILVVDDEPDICWVLENGLVPAGYTVTTTTNGAEAVKMAREMFFNVVLLDIKLTDVEGIELVAPLKQTHPDTDVIIVTGYASVETAVRALNAGVSAYLTKPLDLDQVRATVKEVLEEQRKKEEQRRAEQRLAYMAMHDALTGLPNRTLFHDRLNLALAYARRNQRYLAVMLLDLDHFKDVNDTLGHKSGDRLLRAVGGRLANLLRTSDTVARIGGDEFMVLLPEITQTQDAAKVVRKLLQAVREPVVLDDHKVQITTSIGIAVYPRDGRDADALWENADRAMYHAKAQGRDTYQCFSG